MQLHEAGQGAGGLLALHVRVVVARLDELVVATVGNIALQHVQDEPFLNGLAHGVAVGGFAIAPEDFERFVLGRGGEGEEAQVRLPAALRHAEEQGLHVLPGQAFLGGLLPCLRPQFLAAQHFLHGGGCLPALGTVRLVDKHGAATGWQGTGCINAAFIGHLEQLPGDERELLQGGDDDGNPALQGFRQLARAFVHLPHHAVLVLELVDRVLQLLIEHDAVRHHDHAVENAGAVRIVQRGQTMRQPSDGVALAAAGGMLDQGVVPHAFAPRQFDQQAHGLQLVVAREDQSLDLGLAPLLVAPLFTLQMQKTGQQVQQAAALQDFLPKVGGAVVASLRVRRVAGAGIAALVEGQKARGRARQPGGHPHGFGIDGKVNQRAPLELKDGRPRIPVALVLPAGILNGLPRERVLQLQGGDRDAVQAERQIQGLFGIGREAQLPGDAHAVCRVAGVQLRVQLMGRLEVGDAQVAAVALEAVPQGRQSALIVHPFAEVGQHLLARLPAKLGFQLGPFIRLRLADEVENSSGKDGAVAVKAFVGNGDIAVCQQVRLNNGLEGGFGGGVHGAACSVMSCSDATP